MAENRLNDQSCLHDEMSIKSPKGEGFIELPGKSTCDHVGQ